MRIVVGGLPVVLIPDIITEMMDCGVGGGDHMIITVEVAHLANCLGLRGVCWSCLTHIRVS
jgi:hypothetical protein